MKRIIPSIIFLLISTAAILNAQWTPTSGPDAGQTNDYAFAGSTIYAATRNGVFRSTDDGVSWERTGLAGKPGFRIAVQGSTIYATASDSLFRSDNNGVTWKEIHPDGVRGVRNILISGSTIYIATFGGPTTGLYSSTDNGTAWTNIIIPDLVAGSVRDIVESGNYLIAASAFAGVFRSDDHGATWSRSMQGLPADGPVYLWDLFADGPNVYIAADSNGFYSSSNNGATWKSYPNNGLDPNGGFYALAANGSTILASVPDTNGFLSGFYRSTNGGQQWSQITSNGLQDESVYNIDFNAGKFYVSAERGAYVSSDGGASWRVSASGLNNAEVLALQEFNGGLYAATSNGIHRTTNDGGSWKQINSESESYFYGLLSFNNQLYAISSYEVFRYDATTDQFVVIDDGSLLYNLTQLLGAGTTLYATDDFNINRSTDGGVSWEPLISLDSLLLVRGAHATPTDLYAITQPLFDGPTRLFHSTNSGTDWRITPLDIPTTVTITGMAGNAGGLYISADDGSLWKSTNKGVTWTLATYGLPANEYINGLVAEDEKLFAEYYQAIYLSTDNGTTWNPPFNDGLPASDVYAVKTDRGYLYAGTYGAGVWRHLIEPLGVEEIGISRAMLHQNYPNPVETRTTIGFDLPQGAHTTLSITNALGERVATLLDSYAESGSHTIGFDATMLPGGIYGIELRAGDRVERRAMVVVR